MNIFENLENLGVSEACFNDIIDIVEGILSNKEQKLYNAAKKSLRGREDALYKASEKATQAQIKYGCGEPEGVPYAEFDKNMREHVIPAFNERRRAVKRKRHAKEIIKTLNDKRGRVLGKDTSMADKQKDINRREARKATKSFTEPKEEL